MTCRCTTTGADNRVQNWTFGISGHLHSSALCVPVSVAQLQCPTLWRGTEAEAPLCSRTRTAGTQPARSQGLHNQDPEVRRGFSLAQYLHLLPRAGESIPTPRANTSAA